MEYTEMSREDYISWDAFRNNPKNSLTNEELEYISRLHAKYFKHKYFKPCTCNPRTIKNWIADLNKLFLK